MESNEDTFKPDTVFDSFHHQAKIFISNRALLAAFLMLWLKRCVVPHYLIRLLSQFSRSSFMLMVDLSVCSPLL